MEVDLNDKRYEILSPIFFTAKIFGMLPISTHRRGNRVFIKKSTNYLVYNIMLTILTVAALIYADGEFFGIPYIQHLIRGANRYTTYLDSVCSFLVMTTRVILAPLKMKSFISLLKDLDDVDTKLPMKENRSIRNKRAITIVIWIISILVLGVTLFECYARQVQSEGAVSFEWHLLCRIPRYFLEYYTMLLQLFYAHMVYNVLECIVALNNHLSSPMNSVDVSIIQISEYVARINQSKHNKKDLSTNTVFNSTVIHRKICNVVYQINDVFGFLLLILMLMAVFDLVTTPYQLYTAVKASAGLVVILKDVFWFLLHVTKIIMLVEVCGRCSDEINNTLEIVRHHLSTNLPVGVRSQYELLSTQLRQCPIEFTIMGISTIDRGLLASVASLVTTYLVILFQVAS